MKLFFEQRLASKLQPNDIIIVGKSTRLVTAINNSTSKIETLDKSTAFAHGSENKSSKNREYAHDDTVLVQVRPNIGLKVVIAAIIGLCVGVGVTILALNHIIL